jgi:hypothetical protein
MNIDYGKEWDAEAIWTAEQGGLLPGIIIESHGKKYEICIYSIARIKLSIDGRAEHEGCFLIDPGTVVITESVTVENVEKALRHLDSIGYFDLLKPMEPAENS